MIQFRAVTKKYKNDNYIIIGVTARNLASASNVCDINMFNYLILNCIILKYGNLVCHRTIDKKI